MSPCAFDRSELRCIEGSPQSFSRCTPAGDRRRACEKNIAGLATVSILSILFVLFAIATHGLRHLPGDQGRVLLSNPVCPHNRPTACDAMVKTKPVITARGARER